jgi:hypothetical protein
LVKQAVSEWRKRQDEETKLADQLKQRGLYVDNDGELLSTPADVDRSEYDARFSQVTEELRWFGPFVTEPIGDVLFRRFALPFFVSALANSGAEHTD